MNRSIVQFLTEHLLELAVRESRPPGYARGPAPGRCRAGLDELLAVDTLGHEGADEEPLGRAVVDTTAEPPAAGELERVARHLVAHHHVLDHPLWRWPRVIVADAQRRQHAQVLVLWIERYCFSVDISGSDCKIAGVIYYFRMAVKFISRLKTVYINLKICNVCLNIAYKYTYDITNL